MAKAPFKLPNNSLEEKWPKTTLAILRCANTFGRVVYISRIWHCRNELILHTVEIVY